MFFRMNLLLACAAFSVISVVQCAKIPDFIKICHRSDPNVEKCILDSIEHIRPHLKNGVPELDIPAIEPLVIPQVGVPGSGGSNNPFAVGRNVQIYGISDFKIDKLKLDLANPQRPIIHIALTMPHLESKADYEVNTRVLVLPVQGKGEIQFNATNTKADLVLYGQIFKKGNNNYIRFIRMDMTLKMEDYSIHLGNLFNGDKLLGEATNQALNENKNEFKEALSPIVTKEISEIVIQLANKIAKNHPYDTLFPN